MFTIHYRTKDLKNYQEIIFTRPFSVYSNKHNRCSKKRFELIKGKLKNFKSFF